MQGGASWDKNSILLGSARWAPHGGWYKEKAYATWLVFGGHPDDPETVRAADPKSRHFLSVAPTRSGKGASLIIPNLLFYYGSAIVIDPKGENAWVTAKRRRELGQKTIILDPWGEVNRRYGEKVGEYEDISRFNPLSILDPANDNYADDLAYIADALIINQGKDPHWDDSARELVAGLISYLVETAPETASLPLLRILLSKPYEEIAGIAAETQKLGFESVAARKMGRFSLDSKEISSIVSTALTQTAFLDSVTLGESLLESDFSFADLVEQKTTIYLVLPVDKLQTYGRWLRLMVSIGIRTVARTTKKLNKPVLFILDEFGTIGRLSAVAQAYGLMAGLQMCIWAFVQDFIQLKRDYPDDWETFIANCEALTVFNIMDNFTANYISEMLGSETIEKIHETTEEVRRGGWISSGVPDFTTMSDQVFARDLLQPSEIRRMNQQTGIVIQRDFPSIFKKINYFEDPFLYQKARHNPYFRNLVEEAEEEDFKRLSRVRLDKFARGGVKDWRNFLYTVGYQVSEEKKNSFFERRRFSITNCFENRAGFNEDEHKNISKAALKDFTLLQIEKFYAGLFG